MGQFLREVLDDPAMGARGRLCGCFRGPATPGRPAVVMEPLRSLLMAGSNIDPVSNVVNVLPSQALDRCVDVILKALILCVSRSLPRA